MHELNQRTNFDIIRYANCWEDADVLLKALQLKPGSAVLSIASAGDNTFSILSTDPEIVMAADLSEIQLYLLELKRAAMQVMEREEFMAFIGITPSKKRLQNFDLIKNQMPSNCAAYWELNRKIIEDGLIYGGKFENYFKFFRTWLLPLVHSKKVRLELFEDKDSALHEAFYKNTWNNFRWRLLFRIFFSRKVMGKYGRDPEFLKEVNVPVHEYIFQKAEKHLISNRSQKNYFLRMILLGEFGALLPHYLREENYNKIRQNLNRIKTFKGYAEQALPAMPAVDGCNLSNIFEYMPIDKFREITQTIANDTPAGCRIAYWNLMVPRRLSAILPEKYEYDPSLSTQLTAEDYGFFYNGIHLDIRR